MTHTPTPPAIAALERTTQRRETPCGDGTMVWRIWGEGPPVILLHGAFGSWLHWASVIGPLSAGYRVFAADIPGYGDSALPPEPYGNDSVAAIIADGFKSLADDQPCAVIGFSMGSHVAGAVAKALGPRARAMVIVGTGNMGVPRPLPRESPLSWRKLATQAERDAAHRRNLEIVMIHDPARIDDQAVWIQAYNAPRARLKGRRLTADAPLRRHLGELTCEVAGIWADRDPGAGPYLDAFYGVLCEGRTDAKFVTIQGAGHWSPYEAPDRVHRALAAILGDDRDGLFKNGPRVTI